MMIGVDWGGTKIEFVALDHLGAELFRTRKPTPRHDYSGCIELISKTVAMIEAKLGLRGTVGIGIPGSLEPISRIAKGASSTWLLGKDVESDLRKALKREVRLENDADCFAASEARDGAGIGHRLVFAVILGSGAGAGIAIDGRAHHGPNNSSGEWGHNPLPFPNSSEIEATRCYCGRNGCLETWISGRAFEAQYDLLTNEKLTARDIILRKRDGDRLANSLWDTYIERVARGLSIVVNTLDPDVFVMGGGMSNTDELYTDLPPLMEKFVFSTVFKTPIRKAIHGDASGVRGAAFLWV
jgi:fructokinase